MADKLDLFKKLYTWLSLEVGWKDPGAKFGSQFQFQALSKYVWLKSSKSWNSIKSLKNFARRDHEVKFLCPWVYWK